MTPDIGDSEHEPGPLFLLRATMLRHSLRDSWLPTISKLKWGHFSYFTIGKFLSSGRRGGHLRDPLFGKEKKVTPPPKSDLPAPKTDNSSDFHVTSRDTDYQYMLSQQKSRDEQN